MTRKKHQAREALRVAAIAISDEVWAGKWAHVPDLTRRRIPEWNEVLDELERRAPGHLREAYVDALTRAHLLRR